MADEQNKDQDVQKDGKMQKHAKGGGNRNAIAYGILQANGYNTRGMSPADIITDDEMAKQVDDYKRDKADKLYN